MPFHEIEYNFEFVRQKILFNSSQFIEKFCTDKKTKLLIKRIQTKFLNKHAVISQTVFEK